MLNNWSVIDIGKKILTCNKVVTVRSLVIYTCFIKKNNSPESPRVGWEAWYFFGCHVRIGWPNQQLQEFSNVAVSKIWCLTKTAIGWSSSTWPSLLARRKNGMQLHRADCLVLVICRNCCNCPAILDVLLNTERDLALLALVWYNRIDINFQIVDLDIDNSTLIIFDIDNSTLIICRPNQPGGKI